MELSASDRAGQRHIGSEVDIVSTLQQTHLGVGRPTEEVAPLSRCAPDAPVQRVGWAGTQRRCPSPPGEVAMKGGPQPSESIDDRWFLRVTLGAGVMVWIAVGVPVVVWIL